MKASCKTLMFAGKDGRVILAHLLCCARLAVCLYSGTPRAAHLCQTDAMQNQGGSRTESHLFERCRLSRVKGKQGGKPGYLEHFERFALQGANHQVAVPFLDFFGGRKNTTQARTADEVQLGQVQDETAFTGIQVLVENPLKFRGSAGVKMPLDAQDNGGGFLCNYNLHRFKAG